MRKELLVEVLTILCLSAGSGIFAQPRFEVPLTVTDGAITETLYFGILPGASFCIVEQDSMNGHEEAFLPPVPPTGDLEAYLVWPRNGFNGACFSWGSFSDYRPFTSYSQKDTFRIRILPGSPPPVSVSWPSGLQAHFSELVLKDVATNGGRININMLSGTSVVINLDTIDVRVYASCPHMPNDTLAVSVQLQPGWNMVSNPVIAANDSVPLLFPVCLGCGVGPPPTWIDSCLLHPGMGRWLKCPTGGTTNIMGLPMTNDSIRVVAGWNMIGSISHPVAVSTIFSVPPGIRTSDFFAYTSRYAKADTIQPGHAYWLRVNQAGWIVLSSGL